MNKQTNKGTNEGWIITERKKPREGMNDGTNMCTNKQEKRTHKWSLYIFRFLDKLYVQI